VYEIKSTHNGEQWLVHKRYSDFVQLRQNLRSEAKLPKRFPIRSLLAVEIKEEEKVERQNLLQVFLVTVVGQSRELDYSQKKQLGMFLGLMPDESFPAATDLTSTPRKGHNNLALCVTPSASPNMQTPTSRGSKWLNGKDKSKVAVGDLQRELAEKDIELAKQTEQARMLADQLSKLAATAQHLQVHREGEI
jgi:hypothetical protein